MSSPNQELLSLNLLVNTEQPEVLTGLDTLLQLGLISQAEVRRVCQQSLSCKLPVPVVPPAQLVIPPKPVPAPEYAAVKPPRKPVFAPWEALKAELSVRWLLFLGVLMVVMSSGLLAASQWERFPAFGQYGILLAYTLVFFAVSLWANRQSNLHLTSQTLQLVTLLLVPVNFWAMDGFGLWHSLGEWLTVVLAAVILTGVTRVLLRKQANFNWLILANSLGLSYGNLGWKLPGLSVPLIACYLGTIFTAFVVWKGVGERQQKMRDFLSLGVVVYGLIILLSRAIFVVGVPVAQLGLAIGICGWLFVRLSQRETEALSALLWGRVGAGLLILGWAVSVWGQTWQAFLISLLGISCLVIRLLKFWCKIDLTAIYLIGWQAIFLVGKIIPPGFRKTAITTGVQLASAQESPGSLLSVTWLPYLVLMLWVNGWLLRKKQQELANYGDKLALGFGVFLTILGAPTPSMRALNLLGSLVILGWMIVTRKQRNRVLIYLTNLGAILTIFSWINWLFPALKLNVWVMIILGLMTLEWLFLIGLVDRLRNQEAVEEGIKYAQESAWYFGCLLAGLSYVLLLEKAYRFVSASPAYFLGYGFWWFLVPVMLTILARMTHWQLHLVSGWLSVGSLVLEQFLIFSIPTGRFFGAGLATILMLLNTRFLRHRLAALITVGFGLSLVYFLLLDGIFGLPKVINTGWWIVAAVIALGLWVLRGWILVRQTSLAEFYTPALDIWAVGISGLEIIYLPLFFWMYEKPLNGGIAAILLMFFTSFRSWQSVHRSQTIPWGMAVLLLAQITTWQLPKTQLLGLGIAGLLMLVNSYYLRVVGAAVITVGFGLSLLYVGLWQNVRSFLTIVVVVNAIVILGLWIASHLLKRIIQGHNSEQQRLVKNYQIAFDYWAMGLCLAELLFLSIRSFNIYLNLGVASTLGILASGITALALLYRTWQQPNNWLIYGFGWSLELFLIESLGILGRSIFYLAIANLSLGLISQLLGDWWSRRTQKSLPVSLHIMPLLYGAMAALLRWGIITEWSGFTSLGLVLIAIGIGRRSTALKPLVYVGLIGVSISAYEILDYQISGQATGDKLIAMAGLGASILYGYRLLSGWLSTYLNINQATFKNLAHLHWFLSSIFLLAAISNSISQNDLLGLGIGLILSRYAIMQGRYQSELKAAELWVYTGIFQGLGLLIFIVSKLQLAAMIFPWAGILSTVVAYCLYILPWQKWGWIKTPWLRAAVALPTLTAFLTASDIQPVSLLFVAIFYLFLARLNRSIRISYFGLFFINWLFEDWFLKTQFVNNLAYVTPPALSLLYIASFDPDLKTPQNKPLRHLLRLLGAGVINFVALFTSPLIAGFVSLVAIFAGLALKIRAFLYIGTCVFLVNAFNQLVVFSLQYSFLKWVLGLFLGILLIGIAGNFETRREQIINFMQNWLTEWQQWE